MHVWLDVTNAVWLRPFKIVFEQVWKIKLVLYLDLMIWDHSLDFFHWIEKEVNLMLNYLWLFFIFPFFFRRENCKFFLLERKSNNLWRNLFFGYLQILNSVITAKSKTVKAITKTPRLSISKALFLPKIFPFVLLKEWTVLFIVLVFTRLSKITPLNGQLAGVDISSRLSPRAGTASSKTT